MKTTPPFARIPFLGALCLNLLLSPGAAADGGDNFNDNSRSVPNWGTNDVVSGNGVLSEAGQVLRYTCSSGTVEDNSDRPWELTRFPFNADWEMRIDAFNNSNPIAPLQVNSMGITITSPHSASNYVYHELYNSALGAPPARIGANADMTFGGASVGGGDSSALGSNLIALRLHWNSTTKVLTCYYDINPADPDQWIELASFGLAGAGGTAANADWGMVPTDQFFASVYGYSALMSVPAGQMYLDNYQESGGVASAGGSRPEPTGSFPFIFQTGNPLLTRIMNVTGNYKGVTPTAAMRSFDLDLAQDESGKIAVMGTVDGIADRTGNPEIATSVGSIKTVNGEPVAQIRGSFNGTRDSEVASVSGTLTGPVEVTDVAGQPTLGGTGSYRSKVAGVPFSGKNVPASIDAPQGTDENLKQDWSLQLDIVPKLVRGKERIFASATLVLPNGDTIQYAERMVRYAPTTGYRITFRRGTNVTANPDAIDPKSTVLLSGLKFVKTGDDWVPSAGTITYQFLGQKGVEDLMEFVAP